MIELNFTKAELLWLPGIGKMTANTLEEFLLHQGYLLATKDEKEIDKAVAMLRNNGFRVELPAQSSNAALTGGEAVPVESTVMQQIEG